MTSQWCSVGNVILNTKMASVLVIGSGGREHALACKFAQSKQVDKVFVAPGNPGMQKVATCVDLAISDFKGIINFVKQNKIDLTFVGSEVPLVDGIADCFEAEGLCLFGPSKLAARLEGSKIFAKTMMEKYDIPTAKSCNFNQYEEALHYCSGEKYPLVIKADGLAAGKGVVIAQNFVEAKSALQAMMLENKFAEAGCKIVVEEFLYGEEFSLLAFVKGENVIPMQIAQDHKRAFDHDEGENTGGMGAYTPVTHLSQAIIDEAMDCVMKPIAHAMVLEGCPFTGILYGGMMATEQGVKTIEFNVRFGDPETEVLLPALQSDLYEVIQAVLNDIPITLNWSEDTYLGVVMAACGYPEGYKKGIAIHNLETVEGILYHMGTKIENQTIVTNGGRVLFVGAKASSVEEARIKVYTEIKKIQCDDLYCRSDIGFHSFKK